MFKVIVVLLSFLSCLSMDDSAYAEDVSPIDSLSGMMFRNRFSTYLRPGITDLSIGWGSDEEERAFLSFPQLATMTPHLVLEVTSANWTAHYALKLLVVEISFSSFPEALFAPSAPIPSDSVRSIVNHLRTQQGSVVGSTILISPDSVRGRRVIIPIRPSVNDAGLWQFRLEGVLVPEDPTHPYYDYRFSILRFSSIKLVESSSAPTSIQIRENTWGAIKIIFLKQERF